MYVTVVVHRKYIHPLKANDICFRSMYIFLMYDNQKGIFDDDEHHRIHQMIQFDDAMNISIVAQQKYIHRSKENINSFRLMYIFSLYDDRNDIFDDDEHHQIHHITQFVNAMNVTVVVHQKYIH